MEQRVRICDIAEMLGLSTATVSNVIHGKTAKVSDATVRRVQKALEEQKYIPSMAGILLAQNSSKIIGVFLNDHEKYEGHLLEDFFISSALNHLSKEIDAQGCFMLVKKARRAEDVLQFSTMWNMDGVVMLGFCHQDYHYLREHMHIPFVVYDGFCDNVERIVNLTIDNYDGGRQVGAHLRQLGHSHALCLADNQVGVDRERMEGFQAAFGPGATPFLVPFRRAERMELYAASLPLFRRVTAVFASSDFYALELMQFLQTHGWAVPRDISIAGFDDTPPSRMNHPSLTTVHQDNALRAKLALEQLRAQREGTTKAGIWKIPVQLMARESTGPVPACSKETKYNVSNCFRLRD